MDPEVSAIFARAEELASEWDHAGPGFEHVLLALLENATHLALVVGRASDGETAFQRQGRTRGWLVQSL